jgi:hypothetical protein
MHRQPDAKESSPLEGVIDAESALIRNVPQTDYSCFSDQKSFRALSLVQDPKWRRQGVAFLAIVSMPSTPLFCTTSLEK